MPKKDIAKAINNAISLQRQTLDTYKKLWAESDVEESVLKNITKISLLTIKALEDQFDIIVNSKK